MLLFEKALIQENSKTLNATHKLSDKNKLSSIFILDIIWDPLQKVNTIGSTMMGCRLLLLRIVLKVYNPVEASEVGRYFS